MAQTDSGTTGIGDDDLDENGQADATQDQAETGGSGGAGLTRNEGDFSAGTTGKPARVLHPSIESGGVGAGDTRSQQAGADKPDGLGTPESGGNQLPDDLAPASTAPST